MAADLVQTAVSEEQTQEQVQALAVALRRDPKVIRERIEAAQDKLVQRAERYADLHFEATEKALALGDVETATRAAWQALSGLAVRDPERPDETLRVVEPAQGKRIEAPTQTGPVIQILGVQMLGGVKVSPGESRALERNNAISGEILSGSDKVDSVNLPSD